MQSLEIQKQYKEDLKNKRNSDKVKVKIEKWKILQDRTRAKALINRSRTRIASWSIVANKTKKLSQWISIPSKKKVSDTTLKKKKRKELLLRAKKVVYIRDKDICQHCDKKCIWSDRHASHVIPVSATGRLALYPLNMKVLCYHCHLNWRHKNPIEAGRWFESKFPERLKELERLQLEMPMWSITLWELEKIEAMIVGQEKLLSIK